jgi:hypothetical protein
MVAGAVLFGLLGPRMGQRGMRIHGIPATTLQAAVLAVLDGEIGSGFIDVAQPDLVIDSDPETVRGVAIRNLGEALGPAVEPPRLVDAGFDLVGSRRLRLCGVEAVQLNYRSTLTGEAAILFELADPLAFVHFDTRGRQLPLLPGTRIEESITLGASPGLSPAIWMVMIGAEGRATVVVTLGPEVASEIVDLMEPGDPTDSDSAVEGVAAILERGLEPMTRS